MARAILPNSHPTPTLCTQSVGPELLKTSQLFKKSGVHNFQAILGQQKVFEGRGDKRLLLSPKLTASTLKASYMETQLANNHLKVRNEAEFWFEFVSWILRMCLNLSRVELQKKLLSCNKFWGVGKTSSPPN